jgi:histidine triad (HIT) family protein
VSRRQVASLVAHPPGSYTVAPTPAGPGQITQGELTVKDCVFCRIVAGEIPSTRLFEDDATVAFRDVNPAAPAHALVIPRKHVATLDDATPEDRELVGRLLWNARRAAAEMGVNETGYRVVMNVHAGAGQSVFHIHVHVLGGRAFDWPPG